MPNMVVELSLSVCNRDSNMWSKRSKQLQLSRGEWYSIVWQGGANENSTVQHEWHFYDNIHDTY